MINQQIYFNLHEKHTLINIIYCDNEKIIQLLPLVTKAKTNYSEQDKIHCIYDCANKTNFNKKYRCFIQIFLLIMKRRHRVFGMHACMLNAHI